MKSCFTTIATHVVSYPLVTNSGPSSLLLLQTDLLNVFLNPSEIYPLRPPDSSPPVNASHSKTTHRQPAHRCPYRHQLTPLPVLSLPVPTVPIASAPPQHLWWVCGWVRGWGSWRWPARRRSWGWPLGGSAGTRTERWSGSGCAAGDTPERCSTLCAGTLCRGGSNTGTLAGRKSRRRCSGPGSAGICSSSDCV